MLTENIIYQSLISIEIGIFVVIHVIFYHVLGITRRGIYYSPCLRFQNRESEQMRCLCSMVYVGA